MDATGCYSKTEAMLAATVQASLDAAVNHLSASARSALASERLRNTSRDPHDVGESSSPSASHTSTTHNASSVSEANVASQWAAAPVRTPWVTVYAGKDWRYLKFPGAHGIYAFGFVADRATRNALNVVNVGGGPKKAPYLLPYWCMKCKAHFPVGVFNKERHLQLDPDSIIDQGHFRHSQLCVLTEAELTNLSASRKRRLISDSAPASNINAAPRADNQPSTQAPRTTQQFSNGSHGGAAEAAAFISNMLPHLATNNMQITLKCEGFVQECVISPKQNP